MNVNSLYSTQLYFKTILSYRVGMDKSNFISSCPSVPINNISPPRSHRQNKIKIALHTAHS